MPVQFLMRPRRHMVWGLLGALGVLCLAAITRFWALGQPDSLVFDELYYVRDAITQLAHGFPTTWPDDDPSMGAPFTDAASFAVHPPLGKWLIGLGLLVFGDETGWGWRSGVALFGVLTVAVTMRLGWRLTGSIWVALIAGFLLAIDGVHVVLTRVALLDGFLAFFIVVGALCMWRDHEMVVDRDRLGVMRPSVLWVRPWLFAAAIAFGCAASVKWSGVYALAFFLLLTAARDAWVRGAWVRGAAARSTPHGGPQTTRRWWLGAALQALVTGIIALPTALTVYVLSWWGWITSSGGWGREEGAWPAALWKYHADMFDWHSTLSAPHPYQAHPLTWPLGLRPTAMYEAAAGQGFTSFISPLPNLLITWGGVAALLVLAWWIVRSFLPRRTKLTSPRTSPRTVHPAATHSGTYSGTYAMAFVLTGYLSGWLPWALTFSRSAVFQFYTVVLTPFAALALALVIAKFCLLLPLRNVHDTAYSTLDAESLFGRRVAATMFLTAALVLAVLFFPVWSGIPIADGFWRWHLWLPGWA